MDDPVDHVKTAVREVLIARRLARIPQISSESIGADDAVDVNEKEWFLGHCAIVVEQPVKRVSMQLLGESRCSLKHRPPPFDSARYAPWTRTEAVRRCNSLQRFGTGSSSISTYFRRWNFN